MEYSDKKIVRVTLIVLFLSLFLVYVVFFEKQKKQQLTQPTLEPNQVLSGAYTGQIVTTGASMTNETGLNVPSLGGTGEPKNKTGLETTDTTIPFPTFETTGDTTLGEIDLLANLEAGIKDLTGTTASFKEPEVTKDLGLDYQYVLEDSSGTLYIYMGTGGFDYETEVKKIGGDVVIFRTELDMQKNDLPGETAMFINIPDITYTKKPTIERKRVYMVIWIDDDQRVIQLPYDQYHKRKKMIKKIFTESYKND